MWRGGGGGGGGRRVGLIAVNIKILFHTSDFRTTNAKITNRSCEAHNKIIFILTGYFSNEVPHLS